MRLRHPERARRENETMWRVRALHAPIRRLGSALARDQGYFQGKCANGALLTICVIENS